MQKSKGTKLMVFSDAHGLSLAAHTPSASPHEVTLVEATLDENTTPGGPRRIIGDLANDSDPFDEKLAQGGVELISPHRRNHCRMVARCVDTGADGRSSVCSHGSTSSSVFLLAGTNAMNATPPLPHLALSVILLRRCL
ncbi:transposase [Paraburkholderia elongata]|uniref:Transposase IS4-like domain-containing protein n=1 Tax=Paraburkholderia elongata TaxID=2675747 RepID=A0A972NP61_9BURK|nr:transposase [Paraburkholderia elongata]NPT55130.1 hypothetical protein [Paraburkholderia elongata]